MIKKLWLLVLLCMLISIGYFMAKKQESAKTITIGFCGDVMLGRLVNEIMENKDPQYPWGNTLPLLEQLDLRIINLETTLTTHTEKNPKVFNFRALPKRVAILKAAQIDLVNLANNHILDFKEPGLLETIETLNNAGIYHVGAGVNDIESSKPVIITKNGIRIGIIGYTDNEPTWKAKSNRSGTNYIEIRNQNDLEKVKMHIASLRSNIDILIITIHWGPNMKQKPSAQFIEWAHAVIDAGADIIHGHSAHIFQGIELYNNKIILYDTGDFIDDYAVDPLLRNDQSFLFTVTIDSNGSQSIKLYPVLIDTMQINQAMGENKKEIIEKMKRLSFELGTQLDDNNFH